MAVVLETNTSLSSTSPQSYVALSRQLNTSMHKSLDPDHEPLSMDQEPYLLNNLNSSHVIPVRDTALTRHNSHEAPDLPTWTPLKTLGDEGDNHGGPLSDPEVDELSTGIIETTDTAIKSPAEQLSSHARSPIVDHSAVTGQKSPSITKSSKRKTARFDGVLITSPPRFAKGHSQTRLGRPKRVRTSKAPSFSLVDALAHTFNANRHTEDLPHAGSHRHGDAEPIEVLTETDDEQLQLGTRLVHTPLKRGLARARATAASETNSEDASSLFQDVPQFERPAKRLKPLFYDSNPAAIDAILETVEAPIVWGDELYVLATTDRVDSPNIDEGGPVVGLAQREAYMPPSSTKARNLPRDTPARGTVNGAVLTPYLSRAAKFRQRLEAMFGENVTVRRDRAARPRPADLDFFSQSAEVEKEPSLDTQSESATSVSAASMPEKGASGISSTHITTQPPNPLTGVTTSVSQLSENQLDEGHLMAPTFDAGEEQMNTWIVALQRLVKGKVRITDQVLEELSIALAEIESVKDSLDTSVSTTSELFGSLKQVSELHEIPFGDRNKLRQRAKNIVHAWPSMGKPGVS